MGWLPLLHLLQTGVVANHAGDKRDYITSEGNCLENLQTRPYITGLLKSDVTEPHASGHHTGVWAYSPDGRGALRRSLWPVRSQCKVEGCKKLRCLHYSRKGAYSPLVMHRLKGQLYVQTKR